MEMDQGVTNRPCADGCGTLPSCAPLAVPYVPFQQEGSKKYDYMEALANATLFPGLNLPFHVKVKASTPAANAAAELQALGFVITELGLYLDTHQNDSEAFALFQRYVKLEKEGRQRYREMYGPLTQMDTAKDATYTWLNDPWPWEFCMNGGQK